MDDKEAIERTLGGSVDAFGWLVSRYESMVYAVALARVYDHQDAQDVSQEAFLRAYVRLPMLRNCDAFAPWLFMILRRLRVDFMRGKWRKERMEQTVRQSEQLAETSTDPRQGISAMDTAQTLWSRVGQLDDNSREVLSLHYGQEMKVSEIAALTTMKESTIKMRLQKARNVLGDKVSDLNGVWGIAPLPALSAGTMKAITGVGPLKGGIAAGSILGGVFAGLAMLWWSGARDVDRWQDHAPARMVRQGKRTIVRAVLLFAAAMILAPLFAAAVSLALLIGHPPTFSVPYGVTYGFIVIYGVIIAALLGWVFKREIDLLAPREKVKQFASAGGVIVLFAVMSFAPAYTLGVLGVFLVLQYFFINKSNIALGAVPPGFWIAPLLKHGVPAEPKVIPVTKKQIKPWLTLLHEYGLVAPPLVNDKETLRVRLRLKGSLFEKMEWGTHSSFLLINTQGVVSCTVVPRDYVALAQHLGLEDLPGRQELATSLGNSFTRALCTYAEGGDKEAVASSLGLAHCPIDTTNTYGFLLNKYVLPFIGLLLIGLYVLRLFRAF